MKNSTQLMSGKAKVMGVMLVAAMAFTSCLKDRSDDNVPQTPAALVSVINASPGSSSVDFYLDQNRASVYSIPYGNGQDYVRAYTGKRTFKFTTEGGIQTLKSDTLTLQANKFYTAYLANTSTAPDLVIVRDTIVQPAANSATIRLVNVSANAPAVDLAVTGGAVIATNRAYKQASPFKTVAGGTSYNLEIRQAGTTTVLTTLTGANLNSGSVYTVWLQGVNGATDGTKLTAKIQKNAYY
ncbi:DUF4397 domain-containing protein [Mucilaginibacter daejeonensis]|uniref:DUF4397 domain-containing protein n=1 Tax=Mucilaginibacter daejeonensis TaxID=398049 RepID=UPI001D172924|nr:DUF4397 domain-containing protein [Mucilaginibacter daejeonensis]UEG52079.1 DUF4397 domain-containing protein [Mucilaginibacter daejeonensis]